MIIHNPEVADLFNKLANLLEIQGENVFRIRAYRNAARLINDLPQELTDLVAQGKDLTEFTGIGKDLAKKILTIIQTGNLSELTALSQQIPQTILDLLNIQGLGPKKIKILHQKLQINNLADLTTALQNGKISQLAGFGRKTEQLITVGLKKLADLPRRIRLSDAQRYADNLIKFLTNLPKVKKVIVAGSYRRRRETVGDLDLLVVASRGAAVIDKFINYQEITEVISHGATRSTVFLRSGIQVDLRVVPNVSYGAAVHYFTGSKEHNIAIRKMAVKQNLKINEYGVFKGKQRVAGQTEASVYASVGLPYIEPELRENRGEIAAAKQDKLPKLITLQDIRGDLHCHTNATDGRASLEAMVTAAEQRGYEYVAITDHSKHLTVAHGLDEKRLSQQIKLIDKLNQQLVATNRIRILKAIEVDILEDGSLDLDDKILAQLDLTVCSVHYKFDLPKKKQTERIIRAMDNPNFKILGHPTGRLISRREGYQIDLAKICQAAKDRGCALEINAQPERMDLDDIHCRMAKQFGVKLVISTDSHSINNFQHMQLGIDIARRSWLTKQDVLNTRKLADLLKLLRRN